MSERRIGVGSLSIPESDKAEIRRILDSNQISPGKYVNRFETEFAAYHGADHGLFVNSGTDALRIALATMKEVEGWKDGDYVILPALTFVATLNVILQNNLRPVLIDIDSDYAIDRVALVSQFNKIPNLAQAKAIIPVHLFGKPCDMDSVNHYPDGIMQISRCRGWKVIEDSCETMGVAKISGDIACYSTYVAHLIATGIGGLAITNNPIYAEIMRSFANHGRDPYYIPGYRKPELTKELLQRRFRFERIGYSSRATEFEAALGLGQLYRLENHIKDRRRIAVALTEGLAPFRHYLKFSGYGNLEVETGAFANQPYAYMMYPIEVREFSGIDKWDLCLHLEKNGIETREMLPLINQPCYKDLNIKIEDFPNADRVNRNGFYIGCHPGMTDADVRHVFDTFERFFYDLVKRDVA